MITLPQVQNSTLLNTGKIYLIRTPVNGRYGILRLYNMMVSNQLGFEWEPDEEVWVVMFNEHRSRLRILHSDLQKMECSPDTITREELRSLILNASC